MEGDHSPYRPTGFVRPAIVLVFLAVGEKVLESLRNGVRTERVTAGSGRLGNASSEHCAGDQE